MLNAPTVLGVHGPTQELLGAAVERVVVALGVGTVVALLLAVLVVAVEALSRRWSKRHARKAGPAWPARKRGKEAYR